MSSLTHEPGTSPSLPPSKASHGTRILVATDLGATAASALRVAHARATASAGKLAVIHVGELDAVDLARERLSELVREAAGDLADDVEILLAHGDPAREIALAATTWNATLLVVGRAESHSTLGRLFSPGTVAELIRNAPCDVLVSGRAPATGRIVVGTNLTAPSLPILRAAAEEQSRRPATVYAVHCIDDGPGRVESPAAVEAQLSAASNQVGLRAVPQIVVEDTAKGLLDIAKELSADLIIVGSHGEAGIARLLLGSVAQDVVEDASCPVLVVRQIELPH